MKIKLAIMIVFAVSYTSIYAAETLYFYHNDHLGTPQAMTDNSPTPVVVWQSDYKPFGNAAIVMGTITNNLRFPGQYYDVESGLHYNYFRDYDPGIGRYIQSDPIGLQGGVNTYSYALANPVRYTDPKGMAVPGIIAGCASNPTCMAGVLAILGLGVSQSTNHVSNGMCAVGSDDDNVQLGPWSGSTTQPEGCDAIYEMCADECADRFADDPESLPGTGTDWGSRIRRCIAECMQENGCSPFNY